MKVIKRVEYQQAAALIWAKPCATLEEVFNQYQDISLFETFEDRLIFYLIAEAYHDGQTYGRSEDVINALLYEEYTNANDYEKDIITKQVKTALHNLYKARFIRRDRSGNVYLCSHINFYRNYGHSTDFMELTITSCYEDGNFSYDEYNCMDSNDTLGHSKFDENMSFVPKSSLGPYTQCMLLAHRLGEHATPEEFPNQEAVNDLIEAGWLLYDYYNNKICVPGKFAIINNEDDGHYRLVYKVN